MKFSHELFYLFDELNRNFCYKNDKVKPKFGPCFAPRPTLTVMFM